MGLEEAERACLLGLVGLLACGSPEPTDPLRYRLADSGTHWDVVGEDRVLADLEARYPDFFRVVLDPARSDDADLLALREDLESAPVSRANYDALNAVAIGYFELNFRGEAARERSDAGLEFLTAGMRAAKLLGVPWRAYGEIEDAALRDAILDFYADAGSGTKLASERTVGRLVRIVESLERKEPDPARRERIARLVGTLRAKAAAQADRDT